MVRAVGGPHAGRVEQVLRRDRHAGQQAGQLARILPPARLGERAVGDDGDQGVEVGAGLDLGQVVADDLLGGDLAAAHGRRDLRGVPGVERAGGRGGRSHAG
jgi:hypothetical protein